MNQCTHNCNQGRSCTCVITDVSLSNTEAIRKENEQLRSKIQHIENLLDDDAFAISFQTFGQYRTALIKALKGGAA